MRRAAVWIAALAAAALLLACGGEERRVLTDSDAPFVPVLQTADLRVGDSRIVLSLLDRSEEPRFAPDASFRMQLFEPTEGGIRYRADLELERIDLESRAYYIARDAPLDNAGDWAVAVTVSRPDGTSESSPRVGFSVRPPGLRPQVGEDAPALPSPTLNDAPLDRLTAAQNPVSLLYSRSVTEHINEGRPFLLLFATSERCGGQPTCRYALRQAALLALAGYLDVVHVEPFGRPREPALQAMIDGLTSAWDIRSEPQFWFVDARGRIAARLTIVVADEDFAMAIEAVLR